jgi:hypothetical protein
VSTIMFTEADAEHPSTVLVEVTEYEVFAPGVTVLLAPVPPGGVDHIYVAVTGVEAVKVTEVPRQILPSLLAFPEVSVIPIEVVTTVTTAELFAAAVQPVATSVTVTL